MAEFQNLIKNINNIINPNEEAVKNDVNNINDIYYKLPNLVIIYYINLLISDGSAYHAREKFLPQEQDIQQHL